MELKQFVKKVLNDVVAAVDESRDESDKFMYLASLQDQRTIEFDVAVVADNATSTSGEAGVKVFSLVEGSGEITKHVRSASVSRIRFGVHIKSTSPIPMSDVRLQIK